MKFSSFCVYFWQSRKEKNGRSSHGNIKVSQPTNHGCSDFLCLGGLHDGSIIYDRLRGRVRSDRRAEYKWQDKSVVTSQTNAI